MTADLFARLDAVKERVAATGPGPTPFDTVVEAVLDARSARIDGRVVRMFGANNYLGTSVEPGVVEAARRALVHGTGTTGSRVANGNHAIHRELEAAFAEAFGTPAAMVFTTGHQANLSVVAGLCGGGDAVLLDAESHASLFDGAALSGADVFQFRHNDPDDLDRRLARIDRPALVAIEGLYSIGGDVAPVARIADVCAARGARLLVDEAHAFGVVGPRGLGATAAAGCLDRVDVIVGTFSKSLGGVGGFAVSRHAALRWLHFTARSYLFTASPSPSTAAAALEALRLVTSERGDALRTRLWRNVHRMRGGLHDRGLALGPEASPITSVRVGSSEAAIAAWRGALARDVYVNLVLPPACRRGDCRLRVSVTAAHEPEDVDLAVAAIAVSVEDACRASS